MISTVSHSFLNNVMLIDDNPIDTFIHTRLLKLADFQGKKLVYDNCYAALEYLTRYQFKRDALPDVILLDLHLPLMNGVEFLSRIRRFSDLVQTHCHVVILSSGYPTADEMIQILTEGVWHVLEKPLTLEHLTEMSANLKDSHYEFAL